MIRGDQRIHATRGLPPLKGERGSGLVEYAVVFMILITMLLGIVEFGRALYAYHFVSSAAREATRYAMVRGCSTPTTNCPTPATGDSIQTFVQNVPLGIDATQVTATTTWPVLPNSPAVCSTPNGYNAPGCTVQVQVTYVFNFIFPFVSNSSLTMTSTSQMVISQ
jgi:Flp pilus assembly protein TadG